MTVDWVREDHALEARAEGATEALARHRWHWTLDEANPDRVSIREYARQVERSDMTIGNQVRGYALWVQGDHLAPLTEAIERAKYSGEVAEATEAVAAERGVSFTTAARHHRQEVRSTVGVARERAEERGTTVSEEIPRVAQHRERARRQEQSERVARRRMRTAEFLRYEGALGRAARSLREALDIEAEMGEEETELLKATLANVRDLLHLVELRIEGTTGIDWNAELAKLQEAGR